MELNGLDTYCNHPGGFTSVQYAPFSWFVYENWLRLVDDTTGMLLQNPVFQNGKNWLNLPAVPSTERSFDTLITRSKQGGSEDQNLICYLKSLRPAAEAELNRMVEMRYFLLKLTDKRGQKWLLGDLDYPCDFGYDFNGGGFSSAANKVKVNFKAKNNFPIVGIQ